MTYTATYSSTDLGNIFIDLFGTIVVALKENAVVIVTLLVVGLIGLLAGVALGRIFGIFGAFGRGLQ